MGGSYPKRGVFATFDPTPAPIFFPLSNIRALLGLRTVEANRFLVQEVPQQDILLPVPSEIVRAALLP